LADRQLSGARTGRTKGFSRTGRAAVSLPSFEEMLVLRVAE